MLGKVVTLNFLPKVVLYSDARCHNDSSDSDMEIGVSNPIIVKAADIPNGKHFDRCDHWPILMEFKNEQRYKLEGAKGKYFLHAVNMYNFG